MSFSKTNVKARVIAFYLPQYHPIPENDKWWGKGFTEWTNVGRAKPLFKGHYQPKVPADLGYYDLRLSEVREAQAELAKENGIEGFCYYHYWFDKNKQLLERPFEEVLLSKKPNFPFMLCWANESWHAKFWDFNGNSNKKLLIEQNYGSDEEQIIHFNHLLKAFKDNRYITIEGMPAFMIYKPLDSPSIKSMIKLWQKLAKENGLKGIYFIGQTTQTEKYYDKIIEFGFNAVNSVRLYEILNHRSIIKKGYSKIIQNIKPLPRIFDYSKALKYFIHDNDSKTDIFPTLIPNWDHTPRSGCGGFLLKNSNPLLFKKHINQMLKIIENKPDDKKILFIKSWNEWGEGNYLEPDLKFGHGYLKSLQETILK